jgi:hypothetical protein
VSAELSETVAEFKATLAAKSSIPAGPFARLVRKERLRCAVPAAAPACLPPASTVPSAAVAAPDTNHRWRKVEVLSARAGVLRRPSNLSHSHTSLPLCSRVLYPSPTLRRLPHVAQGNSASSTEGGSSRMR